MLVRLDCNCKAPFQISFSVCHYINSRILLLLLLLLVKGRRGEEKEGSGGEGGEGGGGERRRKERDKEGWVESAVNMRAL